MRPAEDNVGRCPPAVSSMKSLLGRRPVLAGLAVGIGLRSLPAFAHGSTGPVKPAIQVPDINVVSSDGRQGPLRDQLVGRATALQLMFSNCKSICPIEAATFARVQDALAGHATDGIQLLSLSMDPLNDTPHVLQAWLERFNAKPGWVAMSPATADLARARQFFDNGSSLGEDHSTAMSLINQTGHLVWRTAELPAPAEVVNLLSRLRKANPTSALSAASTP